MKKLFSMLLVVALAVTCFTTVAFAAGSASVSGSSVTAEAGDTVTLNFTVSGGFMTYDMTLVADNGLTIKGFSGVEDNSIGVATWYSNNGENVDSHSFSVTVKVADDAVAGTYYLTPDVAYVSDRDLNDLDVNVNAGKVVIEAPAHTHNFGEWKTTKEATCTEDGVETRSCECGETETRAIKALGHNYEAKVTAPTCTEGGYTTYTCSNCGDSYIADKTDALGHDWSAWSNVDRDSCDEPGTMTRTCSVCGETETKTVAAGEHTWGADEVVTAPTCEDKGEGKHTCTVCGEVETWEIDALGHDWGEWEEVDEKQHKRECGRCGETETENHTWAENDPDHCWKCGYDKPGKSDDGKDDVLKTGDITPYITFTAAALICMVAAAGYVFKRNFLK